MNDEKENKILEEEGYVFSLDDNGEAFILKKDKRGRKKFIIFLIILFLFIGALTGVVVDYHIVNTKINNNDYNSNRRINIDLNNDGKCDINCDTNNDKIPDYNIDYNDNNIATFNVDKNGDKIADWNMINQLDENGKCIKNCDTNGDGHPDNNIDYDGDGICDLYCDNNESTSEPTNEPINESTNEQTNESTSEQEDNNTYYIELDNIISLNAKDIKPGWTGEQSFTIKNSNGVKLKYNLEWFEVTNDFTEKYNLYYTVYKNNVKILDNLRAPYTNSVLKNDETVSPYSQNNYVIKYEFKEFNENQDIDQNKIFKSKIKVKVQ